MQKLNHNYEVSYTAICKTKCEIYQLSRTLFLKRFPRELQKPFQDLVQQRSEFFFERIQKMAKTRSEMNNQNIFYKLQDSAERHLYMKVPSASPHAITKFRKQML